MLVRYSFGFNLSHEPAHMGKYTQIYTILATTAKENAFTQPPAPKGTPSLLSFLTNSLQLFQASIPCFHPWLPSVSCTLRLPARILIEAASISVRPRLGDCFVLPSLDFGSL